MGTGKGEGGKPISEERTSGVGREGWCWDRRLKSRLHRGPGLLLLLHLPWALMGSPDVSVSSHCSHRHRRSERRVLDLTLDFNQVQSKGASEALARFPFWLPSAVKAEMPWAKPKPAESARKGPRQPWEPVQPHTDLFLRGPFKIDRFLSGLLNKVEGSYGSLRLL